MVFSWEEQINGVADTLSRNFMSQQGPFFLAFEDGSSELPLVKYFHSRHFSGYMGGCEHVTSLCNYFSAQSTKFNAPGDMWRAKNFRDLVVTPGGDSVKAAKSTTEAWKALDTKLKRQVKSLRDSDSPLVFLIFVVNVNGETLQFGHNPEASAQFFGSQSWKQFTAQLRSDCHPTAGLDAIKRNLPVTEELFVPRRPRISRGEGRPPQNLANEFSWHELDASAPMDMDEEEAAGTLHAAKGKDWLRFKMGEDPKVFRAQLVFSTPDAIEVVYPDLRVNTNGRNPGEAYISDVPVVVS